VANVKLVLEYDGSFFHGFQVQPGKSTVQAALIDSLELVLRKKIKHFYVAGRTDAGVHARGQVVNFHIEGEPDLRRLVGSVNGLLRGKVSVKEAEFVPAKFNARRDALRKQYSYYILQRTAPPALEQGRVWHVRVPLDLERMRSEAEALVGKHDFSSMRAVGCVARSPVKDIYSSEILCERELYVYRVIGRSFLKHMVRSIVGTLVDIGRGKLKAKSVLDILDKKDRRAAGMTAPACGLYLDWVEY
jgi:tRNA pseudouridine38-40 synthase